MGSEWEGANRDLDRAVALGAGDAVAHRNRAVLLYCLGRFSEAEAEARRGIDLDPLGTQAWNTLGMVLTATGKPKEAQRVLERALEIYPGQAYAIATLTDALLVSGEPERALDLAQKIPWEPVRLAAVARAQNDVGHAAESRHALDALVASFAATDAAAIAGV